jgi:hypothetical protein
MNPNDNAAPSLKYRPEHGISTVQVIKISVLITAA